MTRHQLKQEATLPQDAASTDASSSTAAAAAAAAVADIKPSLQQTDDEESCKSVCVLLASMMSMCEKLLVLDYTVWVKKIPPPDFFWHFFQNGWEFLVQILCAYYTFPSTPDHKFLFNYLQLWQSYAILSETTIIFLKCPPSVEMHTWWLHLIWHNFVTVGDNVIKIYTLSYIGTYNRCAKFWPKIPNCLGKMSENASVLFGQWWTFWICGVNWVVGAGHA